MSAMTQAFFTILGMTSAILTGHVISAQPIASSVTCPGRRTECDKLVNRSLLFQGGPIDLEAICHRHHQILECIGEQCAPAAEEQFLEGLVLKLEAYLCQERRFEAMKNLLETSACFENGFFNDITEFWVDQCVFNNIVLDAKSSLNASLQNYSRADNNSFEDSFYNFDGKIFQLLSPHLCKVAQQTIDCMESLVERKCGYDISHVTGDLMQVALDHVSKFFPVRCADSLVSSTHLLPNNWVQ